MVVRELPVRDLTAFISCASVVARLLRKLAGYHDNPYIPGDTITDSALACIMSLAHGIGSKDREAVSTVFPAFDFDDIKQIHAFGVGTSDTVYVTSQAEYLPIPPSTSVELRGIFSGHLPRYAYDNYFYLAMVPVEPRLEGPLLGCLSPIAVTAELARDGPRMAGWQLLAKQQQEWCNCERIILEVQRRLVLRAGLTPLDMIATPAPFSFGYTQVWETQPKLYAALKKAVSAFVMRLALISYFLLVEETEGKDPWFDLTSGPNPMPMAICNALRVSWINDWSQPRVGAFVDIGMTINPSAGCQWHKAIPAFLSKGSCIPLWFAYPAPFVGVPRSARRETKVTYSTFHPSRRWFEVLPHSAGSFYRRESEDIPESRQWAHYLYSAVTIIRGTYPESLCIRRRTKFATHATLKFNGAHTTYTITSAHVPSHAQVYSQRLRFRYRQLPNETYEEFMIRTRADNMLMYERETLDERNAREAREVANVSQPLPKSCAPSVYMWVTNTSTGCELRSLVTLSDVEALWNSTTKEMRTYNSYRDEYDIRRPPGSSTPCMDRTLEEETHQEGSVVPSGSDDGADASTVRWDCSDVQSRIPAKRKYSGSSDESRENEEGRDNLLPPPCTDAQLGQAVSGMGAEITDTAPSTLNLWDTLRIRYGWVPGTTKIYPHSRPIAYNDKRSSLLRMLGFWSATEEVVEEQFDAIHAFVRAFAEGVPKDVTGCDLIPYTATSDLSTTMTLSGMGDVFVMCGTEARQSLTSGGYAVVVHSAFAVHFARRAGYASSPSTALKGLVDHGVRCDVFWRTEHTYPVQLHIPANQLLGGRPIGIGVLQPANAPTLEDYKVYERIRHTFLRGPAGAVALMRGGILWRLTIGSRGTQPSIPDLVCYRNGDPYLVTITTVETESFVHRTLSTQEEYMICGVYRVLTPQSVAPGRGQKHPDGATLSWWPLSDTWEKSGMHTGFWSQQAEEWFSTRLASLRAGVAQPKSNRQWVKELRRMHKQPMFLENHESLSRQSLSVPSA